VFIDILPMTVLFGLGISLVVAPLTSTLMSSISGRYSGLGSAINNAVARVGQPLLGALIFIVVSATYYAALGPLAGVDASDPRIRHAYQPLNPPAAGATATQVTASTQASIDAFHVAMLIGAGLLAIGALISWFGLRDEGGGARPGTGGAGPGTDDAAGPDPAA